MTDLAEFLLARIAERKAIANTAWHGTRWEHRTEYPADEVWTNADAGPGHSPIPIAKAWDPGTAAHIAAQDPQRVLAECEAKRRIVDELIKLPHYAWDGREEYGCPRFTDAETWAAVMGDQPQLCDCGRDAHVERTLRFIALPYADHPDYREEWRP